MDESWTPEQRARVKDIAMHRLREMKYELEEEQSRWPRGETFLVPIDYHNRFSVSLEDLRRAGVNIPPMFNNRVDEQNDVQVPGNYILGRVIDVLDWIDSQPAEFPSKGR